MEIEVWQLVPGWPEYEVSTYARVRRVTSAAGTRAGRFLKPTKLRNGYLKISFCRNGKRKEFYLHRIVAATFIGKADGLDVCHFDGNRVNCMLSNLRYDTRKGNMADAVRHGTTCRGELKANSKYTKSIVTMIKIELEKGMGLTACSKMFSIPVSTIQGIKDKRTWAWLHI